MGAVPRDEEDLVVLDLARRLRRRSRVSYERFLRFGTKLVILAEMTTHLRQPRPDPQRFQVVDPTEISYSGAFD